MGGFCVEYRIVSMILVCSMMHMIGAEKYRDKRDLAPPYCCE